MDFYTIKTIRNRNFDGQMNIWRKRYGKKIMVINAIKLIIEIILIQY